MVEGVYHETDGKNDRQVDICGLREKVQFDTIVWSCFIGIEPVYTFFCS